MTTDAQRTGRLVLQDTRLGINAVNPKSRRSHLILTLGESGINAVNSTRIKAFCLLDSQTGSAQLILTTEGHIRF